MSNERQMNQQPQFGGGMQGYPYQGMQQQFPGMQPIPGMQGMQQVPGMQFPGGMQQQFPGGQPPSNLVTPSLPPFPNGDMLPMEQSYIENILRLNKGKFATVYMSFDDGRNSKVFTGIIEAAGRDHIILSDPETGKRFLLLMVYLNYVTFPEEIEYSYPLGQMETYSPR
jgi:spore germination protein Q